MKYQNKTYVIIPAGGSGVRFGSKKQFLKLKNKTVLNWSIQSFLNCDFVDQIVVCLPKEDLSNSDLLIHQKIQYVEGGASRSASVYAGFQKLEAKEEDIILIHDAARPLVSKELIQRVMQTTLDHGAVIPAVAVSDTIKEVDTHSKVIKTVPRDRLKSIQTPQGFRYEFLKQAYRTLSFQDPQYTDESMLVEAIGKDVFVVEGERENIKITEPIDLIVAEALFIANI